MATYKKRGYKPKTKVEKQDDLEDGSATAEVFNTLDEGASRTEAWVEKNQKVILGIVGVVAICVLGYLAFDQFIQKPKEAEASNEIFQAQKYYEQALTAEASDSLYVRSLNGGEGKLGMLDIIGEYGSTEAGNMARYYAGVSYLNMNDYPNAIKYLDDFKSDDILMGAVAKGAIGDAFIQLNQKEDALKYYEQAASFNANEFTTPKFLLKAGVLAIDMGNASAAIKHLTALTETYPTSIEATKATAYLGRAEAMK
ncbi:tetratricopeptide repeat protein [Patiriisocius sp. Uisw_047]|jgi:tetratricopeptide (TPR) repeat protein|uniref:tetratricopeptide repeat protein n=1 Tax=Patiriisocius sp. Uisw_047 TaxID=3230969 RepID=UPI0039EBABF0